MHEAVCDLQAAQLERGEHERHASLLEKAPSINEYRGYTENTIRKRFRLTTAAKTECGLG
jgi:hypothetical protein